MPTVLFIHGTGVRTTALAEVFGKFRHGFEQIRPSLKVEACEWGEEIGASLLASGISIPKVHEKSHHTIDRQVEFDNSGQDDELIELWTLLETNPFYEIDAIAAHKGRILNINPKLLENLSNRLYISVRSNEEVIESLKLCGLDEVIDESIHLLLNNPAFKHAIENNYVEESLKAGATARSFVAIALDLFDQRLNVKASIDGAHRQQIESALVNDLGGETRGVIGRIVGSTIKTALTLGILSSVSRNRENLTPQAVPAAGDVLKYLVRGQQLRDFIRTSINKCNDEVIIVAHSLGAIASVDLLIQENIEKVIRIVTVGTQIGLLYELDAMPSIEYSKTLPSGFPRWDNVYDSRDLLAYKISELFSGDTHDHRINNRCPFPRNHSSYFINKDLYELLDTILP